MGSEHFDSSEEYTEDDLSDITERSIFGDIQRWKPKKITTNFGREKHVPQITGCCVMPDLNGTVVICDNANEMVKVLDKHRKVINNYIEVTGGPFDIDSFDENSAVVSIPRSKAVQFLRIHPGLRLEQRISMHRECYGVAVRNKKIYVCIPDEGIQIVSENGNMLKLVSGQTNQPRYVYVNVDSSRIYYSCNAGSVCCVTKLGHIISTYASANLPKPGSLVADGIDSLLVCNNASREIHKLKPDGTFNKKIPLIDEAAGAGKFTSMCSNRSCEILVLATAAERKSELLLYEPNDEPDDEQGPEQSSGQSGYQRRGESDFANGTVAGFFCAAVLMFYFYMENLRK